MTRAANKQLLPVYNKPMVYYPLTTLMLAGCREILLVVNPQDEEAYRRLFGDGRQWGLEISYAVQPKPGGIAEVFLVGRGFVGKDRVGLILGANGWGAWVVAWPGQQLARRRVCCAPRSSSKGSRPAKACRSAAPRRSPGARAISMVQASRG